MKQEFHAVANVTESKLLSNCRKLLNYATTDTKRDIKALMKLYSSITEPTDGTLLHNMIIV